jgi:hypothetical protein
VSNQIRLWIENADKEGRADTISGDPPLPTSSA